MDFGDEDQFAGAVARVVAYRARVPPEVCSVLAEGVNVHKIAYELDVISRENALDLAAYVGVRGDKMIVRHLPRDRRNITHKLKIRGLLHVPVKEPSALAPVEVDAVVVLRNISPRKRYVDRRELVFHAKAVVAVGVYHNTLDLVFVFVGYKHVVVIYRNILVTRRFGLYGRPDARDRPMRRTIKEKVHTDEDRQQDRNDDHGYSFEPVSVHNNPPLGSRPACPRGTTKQKRNSFVTLYSISETISIVPG